MIIILLAIALLIVFFTKTLVMSPLIKWGDKIIHKIPFINRIYKATQDVVQTLLNEKRLSFSQVVFVPFPHKGAYSIGMVTRECLDENSDEEHAGLVSVFVPATPNPTMGFMLLLRREQPIVDMKVEEALRSIISCGVLFKKTNTIDTHDHTIPENN